MWPHHLAMIYNNLGTDARRRPLWTRSGQFTRAIPLTVALNSRDPENVGCVRCSAGLMTIPEAWLLWGEVAADRADHLGYRAICSERRAIRVTLADLKRR